jgi:hypothetical protein
MASNFIDYSRLEPRPFERNQEAGFAASIHDPVWFLGRQWQMGEHQGENASSPVWVHYELRSQPIESADPRFDPKAIPAEAIVESEIDDWWTLGRRVRIGKRLAGDAEALAAVEALADPNEQRTLFFFKPPPPYEHFHGALDGRAVWRLRGKLGLTDDRFGVDLPPDDSTPAWDEHELLYQQSAADAFNAGEHQLIVERHRGGRMDWHSVKAEPGRQPANEELAPGEAIPAALQYPGAPNTRWWQIEDAEVDIGGYAPDTAHTPTALLTELIFSHSDDWFLFPVSARAGHAVIMESLEVRDAFGRTYSSQEQAVDEQGQPLDEPLWPGLHPPQDWTLFQVDGLPRAALLLWHVAELPLESAPIERVQFGLDEESNLLWAVERVVDSREVESRRVSLTEEVNNPRFNTGKPSGDARKAREYAYVPAQGVASRWHPYEIDEVDGQRRLVQRRLVDLSRQKPLAMPAPEAEVLQAAADGQRHQVAPLAIPSNGIELERRWQLARDTEGNPVFWIQRQRRSLLSPPARRLRFDVMEENLSG